MPGSNMNAGLDTGPNQTWCGVGSVLGPDFGEILASLINMSQNLICVNQARTVLGNTGLFYFKARLFKISLFLHEECILRAN